MVVSLGTGLATLIRDNAGNVEVATMLREKFGDLTVINNLEQVSEQLLSVATDTERTHSEAAGRFTQW